MLAQTNSRNCGNEGLPALTSFVCFFFNAVWHLTKLGSCLLLAFVVQTITIIIFAFFVGDNYLHE